MNTSVSPPTTIGVHHELSEPLNWMRVWMTPMTRTPKSVPMT